MNTLNTIQKEGQLQYYELCTNYKDWGAGELQEALGVIAAEHQAGRASDMLEIGCGMGDIVPHLPAGIRYSGLDPTVYAIDEAKRMHPQQVFVAGYGEQLPFPDASFDLVYSFQTVQSFRNPRRALCEAARVLRPGGRLLFISPNLECPWSRCNSLRHYTFWPFLMLTAERCMDLALRFFGRSAFRIIPHTYAEVTGNYEGKDCDLKHLVSTWEVVRYLRSLGFRDIGTKKAQALWMRSLSPLQYYGGGMYLFAQKHS